MLLSEPIHENFVIQIGFNKCGTRSLYRFFLDNGIPAIHYQHGENGEKVKPGLIGLQMMQNITTGHRAFEGVENFRFYSDMTTPMFTGLFEGHFFFQYLHQSYPDAIFILNTRNLDDWIESRVNHGGDQVLRFREHFGLTSDDEVLDLWRRQWDRHHEAVRAYFKNRPDQLIEFDIDRDDGAKLAQALAGNYALDSDRWGHYGRTTPRQIEEARRLREQRRSPI
jgi:hypothetical protein